jgi:hypothetical protein
MGLVALSLAVLVAAPPLATALSRWPSLVALLDSFVLVAVGGVVALHVVPQSASIAGPAGIAAAVVGLFLPIVLHRLDAGVLAGRGAGRTARDAVLLLAFLAGTFIHAIFDGTALAGASLRPELALGVILHRLPVGLALWVIVRPKLGVGRMLLIAAALAAGTITGAWVGASVLDSASAPVLAAVQAFVGGSILHIVAESPPFQDTGNTTTSRATGLVGAALAVVTLVALEALHGDEHGAAGSVDAGQAFLALAFDTAPAVALSFILVGVLGALYPSGAPPLPGRGTRVVDAALGVATGLPHPLCSCTVSPLYTTLLERGASPAGARAFLVAAPELGVPAVLLSARLLGLPFTAARVVGAAFLAWLAGAAAKAQEHHEGEHVPSTSFTTRLTHGLRHAFVDAVDHVAPWIVLGLGVAALLEPHLDEGALASLSPALQTVALALVALPLYLCAAGATPVAAVLVHKGVAAGAALAFLLVGPATSMPTVAMLKRIHGRATSWGFAVVVVVGAVLAGLVADPIVAGRVDPALHQKALAPPSVLEMISLMVVVGLVVASLARQGVRGFLVQIMSPQHSHAHDHDHGPGCDHDHGPPVAPSVPGIRLRAPPTQGAVRVSLDFDPRASSSKDTP